MTQVTTSPLTKVLEVNVAEFDPTLLPLTFHWYSGAVPPFVGVAVNVTEEPEQIVVALAAIDTLTNCIGFTVTVVLAVLVHPFAAVPVTV
jgi:hypothetical protein